MTGKRFTIDKDGITVIDNCTNSLTECKYSQEAKLLCNFLNEVTEDNEQLKNEVYDWKASAEDYLKLGKSLKEENEQLKKVLSDVAKDHEVIVEDLISWSGGLITELEKENEQLKQDKKRLIGYLHRYSKVDVEDIDEVVLNQEYLDEWGDLYD